MTSRSLRTEVDVRALVWAMGRTLAVVAAVSLPSLATALLLGEHDAAAALTVGCALGVTLAAATWHVRPSGTLRWGTAMLAAALAWPTAALVAAVPLVLSGHLGTPLEAVFEAMSALTTTGLSLVQDLDHLPVAIALHRHLLQLLGGAASVLAVLTVLTTGAGRVTMAMPEAGERLLPNVGRTVRTVVRLTVGVAAAGTAVLTAVLLADGLEPSRALLHGVTLAVSSVATGGFALGSGSVGQHHSALVEAIVAILMLVGATSVAVHLLVARGRLRDAWRHLEVRTTLTTTGTLGVALVGGLALAGTHRDAVALARRGLFTLLSAATTTGHRVVADETMVADWGVLAPAVLVAAMAVGGMTASSAGGIKAFRIGVVARTIAHDARSILLPDAALVVSGYHAGRRRVLTDDTSRAATTVLLLFVVTSLVGGAVGLVAGAGDITRTLFESVSLTTNTGLSTGLIGPGAPPVVLVTAAVQMWLGRLEFVAVLALLATLVPRRRGSARVRRPADGGTTP